MWIVELLGLREIEFLEVMERMELRGFLDRLRLVGEARMVVNQMVRREVNPTRVGCCGVVSLMGARGTMDRCRG
jgi:hypothetical protein